MKAKEYLRQLIKLDAKIKSQYAALDDMKAKLECIGSFDYSKDKVQSSPSADAMADRVIRYVDFKNQIENLVDTYIDLQQKIQKEIEALHVPEYILVLTKRYIERKGLITIADEMNYSYDRIRHLHGEALWAFEEAYFKN